MSSLTRLVLPDVRQLLQEAPPEAEIAAAFKRFHAADVAELLEELESEEARQLFKALEEEQRVDVFEYLEQDERVELVRTLGFEEIAPIVAEMAPDDRADFVAELPAALTSGVIKRLPADERSEHERLAAYDEYTAGGLMTSEFVALKPDMTVQEAIEHVRKVAAERETIYALYVVDDERVLRGVVTMRQLILAEPESLIVDAMIEPPISMKAHDDQESVVESLRHYDFVAMPITDEVGRMLGIVTHDDVLDVAFEEADEDAQRLSGMEPLEDTYLATKLLTLVRKRATWLVVLFVFGLLAGSVLRHYEEVLEKAVALIFFLPLIIASGGNSGSQTASLVTRGLAVGDVTLGDFWRIVRRELASGFLLGSLLGVLGLVVSYLWGLDDWFSVAMTVGITLICIVILGSLIGSLLPILLERLGLDPAITSAPLVAGLVDIAGIAIYVFVAMSLMPGLA